MFLGITCLLLIFQETLCRDEIKDCKNRCKNHFAFSDIQLQTQLQHYSSQCQEEQNFFCLDECISSTFSSSRSANFTNYRVCDEMCRVVYAPKDCYKTYNCLMDNTYYRKDHKEHLVRDQFEKDCRFKINPLKKNPSYYDFIWLFNPSQYKFTSFDPLKHSINHIEKGFLLWNKAFLYKTIESFDKKFPNFMKTPNFIQFLPKTFTLNFHQTDFTNEETDFFEFKKEGLWIHKPSSSFGGKGIQLIHSIQEYQEKFKLSKKNPKESKPTIIQKYIENPLLIEGKKFDIRCYVYVASLKPFVVYYYSGFIRRAAEEFSLNEMDMFAHLTNVNSNQNHPEYQNQLKNLLWSLEQLKQYLLVSFSSEQIDNIFHEIKSICTYTLKAAQYHWEAVTGQFSVFGFDFMVSDQLKVYLIEVNKSPSWQIVHPCQEKKVDFISKVVQQQITLLVNRELYGKMFLIDQPLFDLTSSFELLINDELGFIY